MNSEVMIQKERILEHCRIPAVPMVAVKILRLAENPDTSLDELQRAILADQSIATQILKIANSAYYGSSQAIDTITSAVSVMGFDAVRTLTLAASTREIYKKFGLIEQKLWEHSLGVSIASGLIAQEIPLLKKEEAVVAGLLHDIGKVVMNNSQPERFAMMTERVYRERTRYHMVEKEVFGFGHAEVGFILAGQWEFPPMLCDVIRKHHDYDFPDVLPDKNAAEGLLSAVVMLADALCVRLGVGYKGPMADVSLGIMDHWSRFLEIHDEKFDDIIAGFKNAYINEKMFFRG